MRIIASQTGDFSRAAAQNVMQNIVQARRNEITCVYAHNDEMAIGAIQALKAAGIRPGPDVTVVSIDGEKAALELIVAGELAATAESNPRFGPLAFQTFDRFRAGDKIPPRIVLEDRFFDATKPARLHRSGVLASPPCPNDRRKRTASNRRDLQAVRDCSRP